MFGKKSFKFTDKKNPITGIISTLIAAIIMIVMVVVCYQSSLSAGNGGLWLGIVGMLALLASLGGIVLALLCLREKEVYYTFGIAGILLNGLLFITFFVIYIVGVSV